MIDISKLTDADIGRWVVYKDGTGEKEQGKLKSWNDECIFVVYHANDNWDLDHWKDYTAASTSPADLEFAK
jgi:hypothetical protein